jgi:predicted ATPase
MINRLYVNNFRTLENFDLKIGEMSSVLLLGRNGAGKTTVGMALEVLQKIARGTNRVGELLVPADLSHGRSESPVRFEMTATLGGRVYKYEVAFDFPSGFRELRVVAESLVVDGSAIYTRELAQVRLAKDGLATEATFRIDWHVVALPIVQEQNRVDPLSIFKRWLSKILILRPVPSLAKGASIQNFADFTGPDTRVVNLGAWFSGLVADSPKAYSIGSEYLSQVLPDFSNISNPIIGRETRSMIFHFLKDGKSTAHFLEDLFDGERCFLIFALTIASNASLEPVLCFWDEPDNFLAPDEVGLSIIALRQAFDSRGQLIITSHNPEAMRRFPESNSIFLSRRSHLEPTVITFVEEMRAGGQFSGNFVNALLRGDLAP